MKILLDSLEVVAVAFVGMAVAATPGYFSEQTFLFFHYCAVVEYESVVAAALFATAACEQSDNR